MGCKQHRTEQGSVWMQADPTMGRASFPAALADLDFHSSATHRKSGNLLCHHTPPQNLHSHQEGSHPHIFKLRLLLEPGIPCHSLNFSCLADSYSFFKAVHKVIFPEKCFKGNRALQEVWVWTSQAFSTDYLVPYPSSIHDCVTLDKFKLKYNWYITSGKFKVYSVLISYIYILQYNYHCSVS